MIFPPSEESHHSSACTWSYHHMFITCRTNGAVHGYFLTAWWPEVIVFVTPKMGSTSNTKYSNHQFATQSLGKMKFPHLLPPKKTRLQRASSIFSQQETPLTHLLGGQLVDVSTYVLGKYFSPISRSGYSKPFWVVGITILGELLAKWLLNI